MQGKVKVAMDSDQIDRFEKIAEIVEDFPDLLREFVENCNAKSTEAQGDLDLLLYAAQVVEEAGIVLDGIYGYGNK
ncbi:MAG TPA: hypothetical protein DCL81_15745 [Algoriphagus sp.]|jgi:hypothetical protein|nr:hypothetical protein [Algoriphagus sp.]|tara:strand:- start:25 stop:252 length:228 start_codon:yes stop_codon:yes gene_type:complete